MYVLGIFAEQQEWIRLYSHRCLLINLLFTHYLFDAIIMWHSDTTILVNWWVMQRGFSWFARYVWYTDTHLPALPRMVFLFSMNLVVDCFSLELESTDDPAVFEGERRDDKTEVEEKHWEAKQLWHLPPRAEDASKNEEEHGEKQNDGASQPLARHLDGGLIENAVEKPGHGQPEMASILSSISSRWWGFFLYIKMI